MRKLIVIAAAGGALAIGVPAALAVADSPETQAPAGLQPVQSTAPEQQQRPDRDDCPEKDGRGGGGGAGGYGTGPGGEATPDAPTTTPEI